MDLEYALDKKVEQELWNLGFKNYIAMLQNQIKDRKNPNWIESQAMLSWCLEAASGFYLALLQEICTAFDLDIPFRRKAYIYGFMSGWETVDKHKSLQQLSLPHKSSCFYVCQYCLVHLGDIARYRNESKQAELFYRHAVSLAPSSGQPYNQLALLEASRGDKLGTVFHYARSVAVKHPFPVATANLAKTLSALNDDDDNFYNFGKNKLNAQEYITIFLKFHGALHYQLEELTKKKIKINSKNSGKITTTASTYIKLLTDSSLTALVATESLSSWRLIQMLIINLYTLHHTAGNPSSMELLKGEQLSSDEKIARQYILDLIAGSLSALLLPIYTLKSQIIDYFALPSIKLCLDWLHLQDNILLEDTAFSTRLQIWPSLCALLNGLQECVNDFNYDQFSTIPLPEDRDLQGFLPLEKNFENLKFSQPDSVDAAILNKIRAVRILNLGHYLTQCQVNGLSLINIVIKDNDLKKFTCITEGVSHELMKELEELTEKKDETEHYLNFEKKVGGILKPQQSLSVLENVSNSSNTPGLPSVRRIRQNVAMQAIMRRAETEQKQVTFGNISPMIIDEIVDQTKINPSNSKSCDIAAIQKNFSQALQIQESIQQAEKIPLPMHTPTSHYFPKADDKKPWWPQLSNLDTANESYPIGKFPLPVPQYPQPPPPPSSFNNSPITPVQQAFLSHCNIQPMMLPSQPKDYQNVAPSLRHQPIKTGNILPTENCIGIGPVQHINPDPSAINHFNRITQQPPIAFPGNSHLANKSCLVGHNREMMNFNVWKEADPSAVMSGLWRNTASMPQTSNAKPNFDANGYTNWPSNPSTASDNETMAPILGYNYSLANKNYPVKNNWEENRAAVSNDIFILFLLCIVFMKLFVDIKFITIDRYFLFLI